MTTKTKQVTQKQAEAVLQKVAQWLGKRGYGQMFDHPVPGATDVGDDQWFLNVAPTGPDAAYSGTGPMLKMDWDWPVGGPTPTILLEGGPYDWAIDFAAGGGGTDQEFPEYGVKVPETPPLPRGVRVEPYAGYALCIYRED